MDLPTTPILRSTSITAMSRSDNTEPKTRKRVEVDLTKLVAVSSGVLEKAEGLQPSVWDAFKDAFPNPGHMMKWKKDTEDGLTSNQVSQIAQRLRILHPGIHFHSGVVATDSPPTVFVRRRELGWKPTEKKSVEDGAPDTSPKEEQQELPGTEDDGGEEE